ncbi:4Fe-4S dicluster domain-containing protein [Stenotrophomonas mori]|uniref:4Fe-4S binding protein n=1 Tax=Stenotrophomonas mori TaxID=2871096 RepID=A0ABT0SFS5_9GAMM|nr:4Fe-4S dicluster domain-containing protein [Stenotrophomonas mori]MCL7714180.1 4Fe-4S binding protein [Stenotrophomonas mori]
MSACRVPADAVSTCAGPARPTWPRRIAAAIMLGLFFGLPWLRWREAPVLLFDIEARRIHFFGLALGMDAALPLLCLALAALALLCLVTSLHGRLWCAHACPQTVLTRLYRTLRSVVPGGRTRKSPAEGALQQLLWAACALWTGITFVGYFSPIASLVARLHPFALGGWETFWVAFYALATWSNVLFLHEQVCVQLCPYGRMRPWLTDARTPSVRYLARRGEPRGPRAAGGGSVAQRDRGLLDPVTARDYVFRAAHPASAGPRPSFSDAHLGDCIDCGACTTACPIGLDIRNGDHLACIECGACMEACDRAMALQGFPAGLIQRTPACDGGTPPAAVPRARPLLFGALSLLLLALAIAGLLART